MYSDLCNASDQSEMVHQERDKLMRDVDALVHDLATKDRESFQNDHDAFRLKNEVASKEIELKVAQRELEQIAVKDKAIEQYVKLLKEREIAI